MNSNPKAKWFVLSSTIFLSSMTPFSSEGFEEQLIGPLQLLRNFSRPICLSGVASIIFFSFSNKYFKNKINPIAYIFLALQIYVLLLDAFRSDEADIISRIIVCGLLFLAMAVCFPNWIKSDQDLRFAIKSLVLSGLIFLALTTIQLYFNPAAIIWKGRLIGTASHPQHAATLLALLILPSIWLAQTSKGIYKISFWSFTSIIILIFIVWTGSRTGFLMVVVGLILYFRRNKILLFWIGVLICLAIISMRNSDISNFDYRIFNTENTRDDAWQTMEKEFLENPITGIPLKQVGFSENSYLLLAARGGVIAIFLLFFYAFLSLKSSHQLTKLNTNKFRNLADMNFANLIVYFSGALFEGYLNSILDFPIFAFYIFISILTTFPSLNNNNST